MRPSHLLRLGGALLVLGAAGGASAQSEPLIGQIMMVPYGFCPTGWVSADGQTMSIADNTALYSLLGTTYGGDGDTTFAMPDLRGRAAMDDGTGPNLPPAVEGQTLGTEDTTLTVQQLPQHSHAAMASAAAPEGPDPSGNAAATFGAQQKIYAPAIGAGTAMVATQPSGGSNPFDQHQPSLGMRYCVAVEGIYPNPN